MTLFDRARAAGEQLTKDMTKLNTALAAFQERLIALNLGVGARIDFPEPIDGVPCALTLERIGEKWCIGVLKAGSITPLFNASRAVRIAAAPLMTALLAAVIAKAEETCAETLHAKASVDDALEHICALEEERDETKG